MSQYIDGFVIPVAKNKIAAYRRLARRAAKMWKDHGALDFRESSGDDLEVKGMTPFGRFAKTKPGETVVFSWVIFKSRKHRDQANASIMNDPRMAALGEASNKIIDCKRIAYGGFKTIVQL
ncbi:MAG: DUF1428 domain-containing protein [Verrucomicrobia bacterium]|nr:DUF1428 domain-containing protein [Verrucomicrobiota bacterium]